MVTPDPAQRLAALAVLGLTDPVTRRAITGAYRRLARETHPDATGSSDPQASRRFAAIADAYRLLESTPSPIESPPVQEAESSARLPDVSGTAIPVRVHLTDNEVTPIVAGPVRVSPSRQRA